MKIESTEQWAYQKACQTMPFLELCEEVNTLHVIIDRINNHARDNADEDCLVTLLHIAHEALEERLI